MPASSTILQTNSAARATRMAKWEFNVFLALLMIVSTVLCQQADVDNALVGEPEVECGPTSIAITFNTRNEFQGNVFVRGMRDREECTRRDRDRHVTGIELPFDSCNVARTRSLNPRGIFVTTTVVISFHPVFVTKIDRAFRLECFYMETDRTVSVQVDVSEFTTELITQQVSMPSCHYEILDGGPAGAPVHYASLGQPVYHKWTCDSEAVDTFCMAVHSCSVDDGLGQKVQILDSEGCAIDGHLLSNLEYPTDLAAGQRSYVFKYADKEQLFYQCQITINIKEMNSECPRPSCPEPRGFAAPPSILSPTEELSSNEGLKDNSLSKVFRDSIDSNFPLTTPYSHIVKREVTARNDTDSDRNTGSTPFSSRSSETMDVRAELTAFDGPLKATERNASKARKTVDTVAVIQNELCVSPLVVILFAVLSSLFLATFSLMTLWLSRAKRRKLMSN